MGYETDKRFDPRRFKGAPEPRRYADDGASDADVTARKAIHRASEEKNQYTEKARPRVEKEPQREIK